METKHHHLLRKPATPSWVTRTVACKSDLDIRDVSHHATFRTGFPSWPAVCQTEVPRPKRDRDVRAFSDPLLIAQATYTRLEAGMRSPMARIVSEELDRQVSTEIGGRYRKGICAQQQQRHPDHP